MSPAYQGISTGPWLKGVVASNQPLALPKGVITRGSNLLLLERGALTPCDGTGIINAFGGFVTFSRGKFEALTMFAPAAVAPYYLVLAQDAGKPLLAPQHLVVGSAGSGTLSAGTYYYVVTALDGAGGETVASNEVSITVGANASVPLTWNLVPNAWAYNIYRGTTPGGETVLVGAGLPLAQPSPITSTVSYTDGVTGGPFPPGGFGITKIKVPGTSGDAFITLATNNASVFYPGKHVTISGNSNGIFNTTGTVVAVVSANVIEVTNPAWPHNSSGTGGTITDPGPPIVDNTSQVVLYQMPSGVDLPISYSEANIVALYPMSPFMLGVPPSGGGIGGNLSSTPSGGIPGMTGMLPQFKQFTNREIIALGNGFSPQAFWDSTGTSINPAPFGPITAISVDAFGVVTVTTTVSLTKTDPTKAGFMPVGTNVVIAGVTNSAYSGTFVVITVPSTSTFTVRNVLAIGQGSSSGGTWTDSTTPLISTFTPAYPAWAATTAFPTGSIIVPKTQTTPTTYLTAIQGGTTGGSEPSWPNPAATNQAFPLGNIADGSIIWQETNYLNSAAPPPPGAGHIEVYANSLWVFNTSPIDVVATGLDGPSALRMSGQGNPFNWNPVNQAFLDRDDGFEGMGLAKFTITALGIPPEGSLIAFKNRVPYQIIGVFGASNFAIQTVSSDMGCIAPRSINFVPGFGIGRYTHMGFAIFDGVRDTLISEQIRPYLFATNDLDALDIIVTDQAYVPISWSALTSNPPMWCIACPIGASGGQLTRIFCYDLVLKAWGIVDLPFQIGCMAQVQPFTSAPITLFGGFSDGVLQRWQYGDVNWYTGDNAAITPVSWSFRSSTIASQNSDQRVYLRRLVLRGTNAGTAGTISITPRRSTVAQQQISYPISASADFDIFADVALTGVRFDAVFASTSHVELDGLTYHLEPRPLGVPLSV